LIGEIEHELDVATGGRAVGVEYFAASSTEAGGQGIVDGKTIAFGGELELCGVDVDRGAADLPTAKVRIVNGKGEVEDMLATTGSHGSMNAEDFDVERMTLMVESQFVMIGELEVIYAEHGE